MAQYNIKQYSPAGDPWSVAGRGQFQTFFIDVEGYDEATITTNKKVGNTPKLGVVDGDLIDTGKTGKKGQKIYKFKQSFGDQPSSAPVPASTGFSPASPDRVPEWFAPYGVMIHRIHTVLSPELHDKDVATEAKKEDDTIPGTKLSKTELEDIFGGSMDVIDIED